MNRLVLSARFAMRSLVRGGQRTVLAVFCIAVGVMAVVSLRLAGDMVGVSLTTNVRQLLGADVNVQSTAVPLSPSDLAPLADLRARGLITGYAAIGTERASVRRNGGGIVQLQAFVLDDPNAFPVIGGSDVENPPGATYASLLAADGPATTTAGVPNLGGIIVSRFAADQLALHVGDVAHINLVRGGGGDVVVRGVLRSKVTAGNPAFFYTARPTYSAIAENPAVRIGVLDILQPDPTLAAQAATELRRDYPQATVQTVQDALDQNLTTTTYLNDFLEIVGLLALLIGGVGIVNTMQVSLRRRRVEVAMLKTTGYRRHHLYLLFGAEAAALGLIGGVIGSAAGIGVSALLRILLQRAFLIEVVFQVSAGTVIAGLAVGVVTSLIFGLLPIVRAGSVRPAVVLRDDATPLSTPGTLAQTLGLYALVVALFTALSASLIGSITVAAVVVGAALVLLGVLTGVFWVTTWLVGLIPVPERAGARWFAGAGCALAVGILAALTLGAVGDAILVADVVILGVVAAPRRVKSGAALALHSLRRSRGRTATTLVALFVGVASVGTILVLGQDISGKIDNTLNQLSGFNVIAIAGPADAAAITSATENLPGLQDRGVTLDIQTAPVAVDGRPLTIAPRKLGEEGQGRLGGLAGVEGYDLARGQVPDVLSAGPGGVLTAADAGTRNVLLNLNLRSQLGLQAGSTVTLRQQTSGATVVCTVRGFFAPASASAGGLRIRITAQPVLADRSVVLALAGPAPSTNPDLQTAVSLRLDPSHKAQALQRVESAAPGVYILDVTEFAGIIQEFLQNLVVLLVALASLSVLAAIVIIGNTVALAMLERRREIGILKAVGHSSRSVLAQIVAENAIIGSIGALAGMVATTIAIRELQDQFLKTELTVSPVIVLTCVGALIIMVTATAAAVAWSPTRMRPLEVLRYE